MHHLDSCRFKRIVGLQFQAHLRLSALCKVSISNMLFIALCLLICTTHQPAFAEKKIDQKKQSLSAVKQKIKSLKKALGSTEEAHKDAADALKASEVAISKSNKKLYEMNVLQKKSNRKLSKLNRSVEQTNQQLSAQQTQLSQQFYHQYTHHQQDYLHLILQQKRPSETARDIQYYRYIATARTQIIHKMQENLTLLNTLNKNTAATLKEVSARKQAQVKARKQLRSQQAEKSEIVSSLSSKITAQRSEIKKLARDEKSLATLVKRLAKAAKKQKARKKRTKKKMIANNTKVPNQQYAGTKFSSLKGKLRLPVKGKVLNRFGSKRNGTSISWKGLFIKAKEGAHVRSIASGNVIFADWMRGFGNLIIIDHGHGYMSLYGNNQAILKSVGNTVKAGDTIASVGNTGGNTANGLYYELRSNSKPVDPLRWSNLK